jgi:rRNA maturation RNase YbeY
MEIHYHLEEVELNLDQAKTNKWLELCLENLQEHEADLTYVFCNNSYILQLNRDSLGHDYHTDIITFDNKLKEGTPLFADMFISIETVQDNARLLGVEFWEELKRVMIHGVLHLCGFNDKTASEQKAMREKENEMLSLYP